MAVFHLLVPLRMHDEGLSAHEAVDAVLRDNLFGLELDPRCTQIAAFALAFAAWKYPGGDGQPLGYRSLPPLNIACSGQGVVGTKDDWTRFANGDPRFRNGMERLYELFQKAPTLGSLLDPSTVGEDLFALGFDTLRGTLERSLNRLDPQADPDRAALGVAARGIALAASLMARQFTLVATNVPYLARGKQDEVLRDYIADVHASAKADLATAFVERSLAYCAPGGSTALVTPQNWLFLGSYKKLREWLLRKVTWNAVAKLGENGFESPQAAGAFTALLIHTATEPDEGHELAGLDASAPRQAQEKALQLRSSDPDMCLIKQAAQLRNRDSLIAFGTSTSVDRECLDKYAQIHQGISTTDALRFTVRFWEIPYPLDGWELFQLACEGEHFSGYNAVLFWQNGVGPLAEIGTAQKGRNAIGKVGFGVSVTRSLSVSRFLGTRFDGTLAVITPFNIHHFEVIGCYLLSATFHKDVRAIDQALSVTESSFGKVPFDLSHWQQVAAKEYPNGLPEPYSEDPTQWLFKGHPKGSTDPLQVAVARLLGYHWPDQEDDALDSLADRDGIVCVPAVRSEPPAADRLLGLLHAAYKSEWSGTLLDRFLTETGAKPGSSLDDWLRKAFFDQHSKLFHQRPFIWHIWDGRKDGFSALVNYHKLTHKNLENLTYSYLGDWISAQAAEAKSGRPGADLRLGAAQELQAKLKLILAGEPPHDIFVRWKPLSEQAIGWNPDLNDGVRMNIRPFVEAGILRKNPNIKWTKDRGKEPERDKDQFPWFWNGKQFTGERVNDIHLTNAEKQAARKEAR